MIYRIVLLFLCSVLLSCNNVNTRQKGEGLVSSLDEYVAALRWGRFDSAAEYHVKKDGSRPTIDTSVKDFIRVTGHTMKKKVVNESLDEASVQIEMQYYHNEYATLKKIIIDQSWWYDPESKRWLLSTDFPAF